MSTQNRMHINQRAIVEACLLAANKPLSVSEIALAFDGQVSDANIIVLLEAIAIDAHIHGLELVQLANGNYRLRTLAQLQPYINKALQVKPIKHSRAALEVLTVIACHQPVTRADIENLRGVGVSGSIIETLCEQQLIEVVGYKNSPNQPELFATTATFLDNLGLSSLDALTTLYKGQQAINECTTT